MHHFYDFLILAASKSSAAAAADGGKGLSLSWGLVLLGVILGVAITLAPSKRTTEVKKPHDH